MVIRHERKTSQRDWEKEKKSVKFHNQQDISGASPKNSIAAFPQKTKIDGYLF